MAIFGVGLRFENFFGVSSYRLMTFVFRVLLYCSISALSCRFEFEVGG